MKRFLITHILSGVVFITGACVLIIEIIAIRILAPYYGNTIFAVSSIISVILAALSCGYYIGGKVADKHPSSQWFFGIILISGLSVILLQLISAITLPALGYFFSIMSGPIVFSILLFFLPSFLLGTLSPYAIRLEKVQFPEEGIGSGAGKIFFWSTAGSIAGSLLTGFVLIPRFGVSQIIIGDGAVLFLLGFLPLLKSGLGRKHFLWGLLIFFGAGLILAYGSVGLEMKGTVYSADGVYTKIIISESEYSGRPARFLWLDRGVHGGIFLNSDEDVFEYSRFSALYKIFKPDIRNALVIGGGMYAIPMALLASAPSVTVDVAEIDPSLFDLAKKYFKVTDNPRLRNYIEDGRRLLHDSDSTYDLIFGDAYSSLASIPSHLTTKDFFSLVKKKLSVDGIFIANIIGDLSTEKPSLIMSEIRTFESVFPNSYFFATKSPKETGVQNIIFAGWNSNKKINLKDAQFSNDSNPLIRSLDEKAINIGEFDLSKYPTLTDNFSPSEYLAAQALRKIKSF